ncbi:hypothetical protein LXL04_038519 [Taraxacum kok-saghyz]
MIHHGKPISESTIIVQYIDEAWQNNSPPFLPSDPYLRAQARFWADFIDKKISDARWRIWSTKGEDLERAKKEFIDGMKVLEGELGEKPYLMGESFGYVDIVMAPLCSSFYALEKIGNMSIEKECPKIVAWAKRCMERESVSKSLAEPHKVYEYVLELQKKLG